MKKKIDLYKNRKCVFRKYKFGLQEDDKYEC